ncbi:MAG TPA: alpha/beta hydrolase, partial [Acidimicrobiales bacterium]|nr:alpha/beta hydrolase [Acidimicrobiales bacterium]
MATSDDELVALPVDGTTCIDYSDGGGQGEPILLVHAGVFGAWFAPLAADSALDGFRTIRMLRAGYASGPAPAGHVTVADHAAHCAALLDSLGIDRAHILAHSSGCVIALQLALDRPDLVGSLILSEPPLIACLAAPDDLEFLGTEVGPVIGGAVAAAARGDVAAAFEQFMTVISGPDYRNVLRAALGPNSLARAEQDSRFFFADEISAVQEWGFDEEAAAAIRHPVLLVQGGASPPPVHRLVAHLAAMMPDTEVATIDGDDHLLPLRSPAALGRLVGE